MSREQRRQQLAELVERLALGAILLKRPANFALYTGGADNRVDHSAPLGIAGVVVTRDSEYVITDNIEFARMREEQTPGLEVVEHPWYEDSVDDGPALRIGEGGHVLTHLSALTRRVAEHALVV